MRDFTLKSYSSLLNSLKDENYEFQTFHDFIKESKSRTIILRHDVDARPENSLAFAKIQAELGVKGTYYFRAVPKSWNEEIIKEIHTLGHEIGYHYECLTTAKGKMDLALKDFEKNLNSLRSLAPVHTICMHGSPMSKYDSKDLWNYQDYEEYDIIAEPYFDINFNEVFYLTDTGRRWDGQKFSVRDKVDTNFKASFRSTNQIIEATRRGELPDKIMFTFHPQRWNDDIIKWSKEKNLQSLKNIVKRVIYVK